ncbi:DUF2236 domain-containing protein [Actinosynnema pretiosum subsp. pretiosum]|uniref:DUF2236 domain-containing protein n=1 Tax=Actinosynnema pretiosum subsp. pretiosum TaxID=103721 RepID=A0AA45LD44_9PSEU|nr:DUF2236 domain-containing protein [Actinosynnema pretiosum subsp. pretiosum]
MGRYANLSRIEAMDPERDAWEILRLSTGYEFPWDYTRALEFALFRTYCVPSISALLARTGEFERRPQKRYDDTALLMGELVDHGYDSPRGKEALRAVNRMHHRYDIDNDDMLYVLSTFVFDPMEWLEQYGWRKPSEHEKQASYHFYRAVGARMGIRDVPEGYDAYLAFKRTYEAEHFKHADTNAEIGRYTLDLFCSWYPAPLRPAARKAVIALLDPAMLDAFGLAPAPGWLTTTAKAALRGRARAVRRMPPRREPFLTNQPKNRTYPGYPTGYRPSDLGTS